MEKTGQHAVIIGSGFGGLGLAALLGKRGYQVTVLEKNESLGGRASVFSEAGFTFDMGPSWFLMPDVFEHFFELLGEKMTDHLELTRLEPSYRIFFKDKQKIVDLYSEIERDAATFESLEPGAGLALRRYLDQAKRKYEIGVGQFIYKNYDYFSDFLTREFLLEGWRLSVFSSMSSYVGKFFKNTDVQKMLQHTLLFLGNSPKNAPALYSMLSHVDLGQGVFYPAGGIASVIRALVKLGTQAGVVFRTNSPVAKIVTEAGVAKGVTLADGSFIAADIVVSNADLHHTDTQLLDAADRERTEQYWSKRVMSPSAFILYLGLNQQFPSVTHHNLVFCKDWDQNFKDIFDAPKLPSDPSFYVCVPSKTDPTVAPSGSENMFVLVPIASGLKLSEAELDSYEDQLLQTMESSLGLKDLRQAIVYKRRFCLDDFSLRYNSYRGSGLGLSHTMLQTAIFRPNTYSKKVKNLFFVGGNTNPGIGMPMCLVSAELVYKRLQGDKSGQPLKSL